MTTPLTDEELTEFRATPLARRSHFGMKLLATIDARDAEISRLHESIGRVETLIECNEGLDFTGAQIRYALDGAGLEGLREALAAGLDALEEWAK